MKKLSCLLLVLCLVVPCVSAQATTAEDFQAYIESLPTEFLQAMVTMFNAELARRGETTFPAPFTPIDKEVTVPEGDFIVGEDIPAGNYTIKYTGEDRYAVMSVYDANGDCIISEWLHDVKQITKLPLRDGYTVSIRSSAPVIFAPYKGLGF